MVVGGLDSTRVNDTSLVCPESISHPKSPPGLMKLTILIAGGLVEITFQSIAEESVPVTVTVPSPVYCWLILKNSA